MKKVAVIPARGGSKRLPRKNIIDFCGRPIISYTIDAALGCELFERVIVSTDDDEIADISTKFGAEVMLRPAELAADNARVVDVCLHVLDSETGQGRSYEILCCLYATAPLRGADDIKNTVALVANGEGDFAMAVTKYHYPVHQAMIMNPAGLMQSMWPDWVRKRSQDVPDLYIDNGSTYVARISEFIKLKHFRGSRLKGYYMPRNRSVDIDDIEDLEIAKYFARRSMQ